MSLRWWLRGIRDCAVALLGVLVVLALHGVSRRIPFEGVAVGDRVVFSRHEAQCWSDRFDAVVVEAWSQPDGPVYRVQPLCSGVPVGPTYLETGLVPVLEGT